MWRCLVRTQGLGLGGLGSVGGFEKLYFLFEVSLW